MHILVPLLFACDANEYNDSTNGCTALTTCTLGTNYETTAPTDTSDRVCAGVLTTCTGLQFESYAATLTSDRECRVKSTACTLNQTDAFTEATATSDIQCNCPSGEEADHRYEFQAKGHCKGTTSNEVLVYRGDGGIEANPGNDAASRAYYCAKKCHEKGPVVDTVYGRWVSEGGTFSEAKGFIVLTDHNLEGRCFCEDKTHEYCRNASSGWSFSDYDRYDFTNTTGHALCKPCTAGNYSVAGGACTVHRTCTVGTNYETAAPSLTSDRVCSSVTN